MKEYKKGKVHLIQADCMDFMNDTHDKYYDLAVVDPPYGIGQTWSKSRTDRFYKQGKLHSYKNKSAPGYDYFDSLFRVSKNQIIWGGNYFTEFLKPTNSWVVWDKVRQNGQFMSEAELAWTSFNKVMLIAKYQWAGALKCERVKKIHPHQKPVKLYDWLLHNYAKPEFKVLDTHGGSFSSAIAAYYFGCEFTGIEKDKDYFNDAVKRFKLMTIQTKLFK